MTVQVEKTAEEKAVIDLTAAMDSVNLINELIATGSHDDGIDDRVQANYKHLEIVLARDHIIADTTDKTALTAAIAAGKAFSPEA